MTSADTTRDTDMTGTGPLSGVRVVSIAVNLPGPVAASRFASLGAAVTKVEPPTGDPLGVYARDYYDELVAGQDVHVLDLKDADGVAQLHDVLAGADILLTSHRTSALRRLGLDWEALHDRHPRLAQVAIVGHPSPDDDVAGHDLTYQAVNGMLAHGQDGPVMPSVLVADLTGAERAVTAGLGALVQRHTTGVGSHHEVALADAAEAMAAPLRHGLTTATGLLGGTLPAYGIYATTDGHIALAALEPHFFTRVMDLLEVDGTRGSLESAFSTRTTTEWEMWATEHDVPLAGVTTPSNPQE